MTDRLRFVGRINWCHNDILYLSFFDVILQQKSRFGFNKKNSRFCSIDFLCNFWRHVANTTSFSSCLVGPPSVAAFLDNESLLSANYILHNTLLFLKHDPITITVILGASFFGALNTWPPFTGNSQLLLTAISFIALTKFYFGVALSHFKISDKTNNSSCNLN